MSNPRQRPVTDPRKFINSAFDLAYGARDGSEQLSPAEIESDLREAGIDPAASWKAFSNALRGERKTESLAEARQRRLAAPPPSVVGFARKVREVMLREIESMLASQPAGVFARGLESSSDDDIAALYEQVKRQKERSLADESRR